jgi:hypothetical protein
MLEQVAGKIVLMQALHDHDDRTGLLVVEPRHQGAGVPVIGSFATQVV